MDSTLNGIYSIRNNSIVPGGNNMPASGDFPMSPVNQDEAEKIVSGLRALANYSSAFVQPREKQNSLYKRVDSEIIDEATRLKTHPTLLTANELRQGAKYAVAINNSGRLMVDGNLYDGVIKSVSATRFGEEIKYVEYKFGNPITVLSETRNSATTFGQENVELKLTKYEYSKATSQVVKTEKSMISCGDFSSNSSGMGFSIPLEIQQHAGFTQDDNFIRGLN